MKSALAKFVISALVFAGMNFAVAARADQVAYVDLTFQSGATFVGTVDLSSNYSSIIGVDGTLYGYDSSQNTYLGSGYSDPITRVWNTSNYATGTDDYGNFLMDGTAPSTYVNYISFAYNYSNAPTLTLDTNDPGDLDGYGFSIDENQDPLVSGSITATPEPGTLLLFGSGLLGLVGLVWFRRRDAAQART